jgi:hypothetical protein
VWSSDLKINKDLVHESANRVLEQHATAEMRPNEADQTHYEKLRSQNNKTNAMQRLALQKGLIVTFDF